MPFEHATGSDHAAPARPRRLDALRILLLDNYDSYTYNLFQQLARVSGREPRVVRNDELTPAELAAMELDAIVISPGPGHPSRPRDFGLCAQALQRSIPVLGVCLGHQGLAVAHGGRVGLAAEPVHGRTSRIRHDGTGLFEGIPQGFEAVRYHSLVVHPPLPACLEATAFTLDGVVMALRHRERPHWGVQFHPESIGTEHGDRLVANFLALAWAAIGDGERRPSASGPARTASTLDAAATRPPVPRPRPARVPRPALYHHRLSRWVSPEDAFVHLYGAQPHAFWLDSARHDDAASRYSLMGAASQPEDHVVRWFATRGELEIEQRGRRTIHAQDLLAWLEPRIDHDGRRSELPLPLRGGHVGYFGYDLHGHAGARVPRPSPQPDAVLLRCHAHLAFDHHERAAYAVAEADDPAQARRLAERLAARAEAVPPAPPVRDEGVLGPVPFRLARGRAQYLRDIEACLAEIRRGETYEVCLTTQLVGPPVARPLDAHRLLRALNPAPFGAYLRLGESLAVLSCSPELFLQVDSAGHVLTKPIKGTARRGSTPAEDERLRRGLATSAKDRAENLMIVDLLRNDLGRVCEIGSVEVPALMAVESFETVHQLVSTVRGRLRPGHTVVDCLRAAFPGGSMTGAPKRRTMEIIDALEPRPRGVYSGCLGYVSADGAAQLAMTIRTAVVTPQETTIGVGGAIVALSDPRAELDELLLKGRAVMAGIAAARTGHADAAIVVDEPVPLEPWPVTSTGSRTATPRRP